LEVRDCVQGLNHPTATATLIPAAITIILIRAFNLKCTSEVRARALVVLNRSLATATPRSVHITNTMTFATNTGTTWVVRADAPGLDHRTISAITLRVPISLVIITKHTSEFRARVMMWVHLVLDCHPMAIVTLTLAPTTGT